jgi:cyclopropane fatty-acyl-phospholipid synthase-like methyltransferase
MVMNENIDNDKIIDFYNKDIYNRFDTEYGRVGWNNKKSQYNRFNTLFKIGIKDGDSILDFGCGLGEMYNYLRTFKKFKHSQYIGVDINKEFIINSIKKYNKRIFYLINNYKDIKNNFDWCIMSGVFTVHISNIELYNTIEYLFNLSNKGVCFNLLTGSYEEELTDESSDISIRGYDLVKTYRYFKSKINKVKYIKNSKNEFTLFLLK